jgi:GT2 family glycosyltransferase
MAPTVSIVFLAFNRREELRVSLERMTRASDYPPERTEVVVVDNASTDETAAMVRADFPQVRLVERTENVGVSGWNDGFAVATGEYVLALDDDCYLPPDGLRRAVEAAEEERADLVSFRVVSAVEPEYTFNEEYRTGLLSFWGCAALIRRTALTELVGYDPRIFVWANEVEFAMRFYDRGFRHLFLPDVEAQHNKPASPAGVLNERAYKLNVRNWAYSSTKNLRTRDAAGALVASAAQIAIHARSWDRTAAKALPEIVIGAREGLRHRAPVRPAVSAVYRRNYKSFASPWWSFRTVPDRVRSLRGQADIEADRAARHAKYFAERDRYYPRERAVLQL